MSARKHVMITGTGRAGTTFLVELLTHLGLDTGFSIEHVKAVTNRDARAGLEHDIREEDCPYIVKSPLFCDYAEQVMRRDDIDIEHFFIPIRDIGAAAESRRHVEKTTVSNMSLLARCRFVIKPSPLEGGLVHTSSSKPGQQEEILLRRLLTLLLNISDTTVPVTFMRYPRIVNDCPYVYGKLKPILQDLSYEDFSEVFDKTVRPELAHSFNKNDC